MGKFIIGLIAGLLIGGAAIFLTFVGVPRASKSPGAPIAPPDPNTPPPPAQVVLKQDMFNDVLQAIFRNMDAPAFPLQISADRNGQPSYRTAAFEQNQCDGKIHVLPQGSGVNTGLKFENGHIAAILAFSGSYNSAIGCFPFTGWARSNFELRFDQAQQTVYGRLNVESVDLDGVNPLFSGLVTTLVQSSINDRVNPIQILRPEQLNVDLPIASSNGKLQVRVKDIRSEVKDDALWLYIAYDFTGSTASGT